MKTAFFPALILSLAASVSLVGCATTGQGPNAASASGIDKCNPVASGFLGALAGAALGSTKNRDTAIAGAVVGAAAGALTCLAINAHSRKTHDAAYVETEYKSRHAGALPAVPTVTAYAMHIAPGERIARGESVEVRSNLQLVDGTREKVRSVREELVLSDASGKEFKRVRKDVEGTSGGGYENTFTFAYPKGASQGVYGVRTELLVNDEVVARSAEQVQLVDVVAPDAAGSLASR